MPPVTPEEFVRTWQESASLPEVAAKAGLTCAQARNKAIYLRRNGVPLKKFQPGPRDARHDFPALAQLARDLAPKEGETK